MVAEPTAIRVRAYNVGFGDCTLITFHYEHGDRHMLIDCGSTKRSPDGPTTTDVADHIRSTLGGSRIDVAVVTHRHRDHVSGFGNVSSAKIFEEIAPRLLVRPWTDHPEAADDAVNLDLDDGSLRFAKTLQTVEDLATPLELLAKSIRNAYADELEDLLAVQVKNAKAIARLQEWAKSDRTETRYCKAGDQLPMSEYIPGVSVRVLGPPTVKQEPDITKADYDDDEFWFRHPLLQGVPSRDRDIIVEAADLRLIAEPYRLGAARELVNDLSEYGVERALQLVRSVDHSLNNTSVVIHIEAGKHSMLFSGDAQIENWRYILRRATTDQAFRDKLANLSLYKIGHHGSRNATPKSFYKIIDDLRSIDIPVTTLMSTLAGFHGKTPTTAVPSSNLVTASKALGTYVTTEGVQGHVDLTINANESTEWTKTADPWSG